jgi:hypothetical protein
MFGSGSFLITATYDIDAGDRIVLVRAYIFSPLSSQYYIYQYMFGSIRWWVLAYTDDDDKVTWAPNYSRFVSFSMVPSEVNAESVYMFEWGRYKW